MTPVRLRLSRRKGFRLQAASRAVNGLPAIGCARPSAFGNPFDWATFGRDGAADFFRRWLSDDLTAVERDQLGFEHWPEEPATRRAILDRLPRLRGRNLACWCQLDQPCHADVLLELANRGAKK